MGKVRNASNTLRTGRIGENTWYIRDGEQIVRQRLNNSNYGEGARRTEPQQERRAKWGNLVNFFKVIAEFERSAYEGKARGVTDYNMFMKMNANTTPIYLTRQQCEAGVSIPAPYVISKGKLPPIGYSSVYEEEQLTSRVEVNWNYAAGMVGSDVTVAGFTAAFMTVNTGYQLGDAIGFLVIVGEEDESGNLRPEAVYRELVLSTTDNTTLDSMGIEFEYAGGTLYFNPFTRLGMQKYEVGIIHTRKVEGQLLVSSQALVPVVEDLVPKYSSAAAKTAAIASYGVDGSVIIAPGN